MRDASSPTRPHKRSLRRRPSHPARLQGKRNLTLKQAAFRTAAAPNDKKTVAPFAWGLLGTSLTKLFHFIQRHHICADCGPQPKAGGVTAGLRPPWLSASPPEICNQMFGKTKCFSVVWIVSVARHMNSRMLLCSQKFTVQ